MKPVFLWWRTFVWYDSGLTACLEGVFLGHYNETPRLNGEVPKDLIKYIKKIVNALGNGKFAVDVEILKCTDEMPDRPYGNVGVYEQV